MCPRCLAQPDTAWHRHWGCPMLEHSKDENITGSSHLRHEAADQWEVAAGFWGRGLPLKFLYTFPPPVADNRPVLTGSFLDGTAALGGRFATDASGGKHTKDPRLRRCSWAVVHFVWHDTPQGEEQGEAEGHLQILGTMSGPLPGDHQAVSKAELYAIVELLAFTQADTFAWTDCLAVWKRWARGKQISAKSRMPGLWHRCWDHLAQREFG